MKNSIIDISIIIPFYNLDKYIYDCLNSLIEQSFKNFEIICVDDFSKDQTSNIIKSFMARDGRIILIKNNVKSRGAGFARNLGIRMARGKFILVLDGDDFFESDFLLKLYDKAIRTNADLVICDGFFYNDYIKKDSSLNSFSFLRPGAISSIKSCDLNHKIFQLSVETPWNKLYLREVILKNNLRFQCDLASANDIRFVCSYLSVSKHIEIITDKLIHYRINRKGSISDSNFNHPFDIIYALDSLRLYLIKCKNYNKFKVSFVNLCLKSFQTVFQRLVECHSQYLEEYYNYVRIKYIEKFELLSLDAKYYFYKNSKECFDFWKAQPFKKYFSNFSYRDNPFIFPVNLDLIKSIRVHSGSPIRICIYGYNLIAIFISNYLRRHPNFIVENWVDQNAELKSSKVNSIDTLDGFLIDYVIVCAMAQEYRKDISDFLISKSVSLEKQIFLTYADNYVYNLKLFGCNCF